MDVFLAIVFLSCEFSSVVVYAELQQTGKKLSQ